MTSAPSSSTRLRAVPWLSALIALGCAWPVLRNGWSDFDESFYVRDNLLLRSLRPDDLWLLMTSPGGEAQFQPVTMLSYALNLALTGEGPLGFHAVDLLLYALLTALVAACSRDVLADLGLTSQRTAWGAFAAGLLFAVHPLHVEAYAWISARKDLLAASLALGAFLIARRARRQGGGPDWLAALVLFALAMGSKVTVAPVAGLIALDAALLDPGGVGLLARANRAARGGGAFLLVGGLAAALWVHLQAEYALLVTGGPAKEVDLLLSLRCTGHYVLKSALPWDFSPYYTMSHAPSAWVAPLLALALGAACAGWAVLRAGRERKVLVFALAWFLLALAPVVNLLPTWHYAADRYGLLATVGLALFAGILVTTARRPLRARTIVLGLALPLLLLSGRQIPVWRDAGTLWSSALAENPENPIAYGSLAAWTVSRDEAEALRLYDRALEIAPDYVAIAVMRAGLLERMGRRADAESAIRRLEEQPGLAGRAPFAMWRARRAFASGDLDAAREHLEGALAQAPSVEAWTLLGKVQLRQGAPELALAQLQRAFAMGATHDSALHAALAALQCKNLERARTYLRYAELAGPSAETDALAAAIHLEAGQDALALARFRGAAQRLASPQPELRARVATGLARAGAASEGLLLLRRATEPMPAAVRYDLARLECLVGDPQAGRRQLARALEDDSSLRERARRDPAFAER